MRLGVQCALVRGRLVPGDVEIRDGAIAAVGVGAGGGRGVAAPGFVDLQVNGFAGVDLMRAGPAEWAHASAALLATGTTAWRPTFITAPESAMVAALQSVPEGHALGAHLEGPFLAPERAGAHPVEHLRPPDLELLLRLLDAGPVAHVTLAPELPGALALVDALSARGLAAAAGHTAATEEQAWRAFDRGVRTVTHLHNAMSPATAAAALAHPGVVVQVIVDGHHVSDDRVRAAWQAARGRFALVTDAVAAAGMGDGGFTLGGRPVRSSGGVVTGERGRLAGSALTMDQAVRNLHALGVPLADALHAASAVPASVAGRPDLGRLAPGAPADVVVLDDRLEVQRVLLGGAGR
ncbi:MAG: amidohydrolase family protein [Solirubrobacteraceae bacterium]